MNIRTRNLVGVSLIIVVVISLLGLLVANYERSMYNTNPDVSHKVIGSIAAREMTWSLPVKSLSDLVRGANLVVLGEVVSDGVTTTATWPKAEGDLEGKTDLSNLPPVTVTHNQFKIEKTLYGKANSDTITVVQLGQAGSDQGQTKIKRNRKMLLVLHGGEDGIYGSVGYEDGMFEIDEAGKVMSFAVDPVEAKYDGVHVDLLVKDMVKALASKR